MGNYKNDSFSSSQATTINSMTPLQVNKKCLSLIGASVFIIGEMVGGGIFALPSAISKASWYGIGLLIFCAVISADASVYLAKSWLLVEEKWPEYKDQTTRNPFATIGEKAVGSWMKIVCSFFVDVELFGVCVVFLILCSNLIKDIWNSFSTDEQKVSLCFQIIVFGLLLTPLSFAGSPQDFPDIAYGAMWCTIVSWALVLITMLVEGPNKIKYAEYGDTNWKYFALAFGTIHFFYGGTCTFPNFQNDMADKKKFPKAVYLSFAGMLLIYLPIAIGGYAIYGVDCKENILENTDAGVGKTVINFLMTFHLFCSYLICLNPLNLDLENSIGIKHSFNLKRCLFRAAMNLAIIFVALSMPRFGAILNLVGAFSVTAVAYVLTPWFYINLCRMQIGESPKREISPLRLSYLIFLILIGSLGGVVSTYLAIDNILKPDIFVAPCYIHWH